MRTKKQQIIRDIIGYSCIGSAIFLQCLVFFDIATKGAFIAVESNIYILSAELVFSAIAVVFYIYIYIAFIRSVDNK